MKANRRHLVLILLVLTVAACAKTIRRYTYPPDFTYIEKKELTSSMWKLAMGVANIHHALQSPDTLGVSSQQEIVQQLKEMEKVAATLGSAGGTNHPMIDQKIGAFKSDIENARRGAEKNPPNYYLAGKITGSCSNCHGIRP